MKYNGSCISSNDSFTGFQYGYSSYHAGSHINNCSSNSYNDSHISYNNNDSDSYTSYNAKHGSYHDSYPDTVLQH